MTESLMRNNTALFYLVTVGNNKNSNNNNGYSSNFCLCRTLMTESVMRNNIGLFYLVRGDTTTTATPCMPRVHTWWCYNIMISSYATDSGVKVAQWCQGGNNNNNNNNNLACRESIPAGAITS